MSKSLAVALSKLEVFETPKEGLEQYSTDPDVAAMLIHNAMMIDGLEGKHVLDLGAGPGILAVGALLDGAQSAHLIDIDEDALNIAQRNLEALELSEHATLEHGAAHSHTADIVVMNPPFGHRVKHVDRSFLDAAMRSAPIIYSVHDEASEDWLKRYAEKHKFHVTHVWHAQFHLKISLAHHKDASKRIPVIVARLERKSEPELL